MHFFFPKRTYCVLGPSVTTLSPPPAGSPMLPFGPHCTGKLAVVEGAMHVLGRHRGGLMSNEIKYSMPQLVHIYKQRAMQKGLCCENTAHVRCANLWSRQGFCGRGQGCICRCNCCKGAALRALTFDCCRWQKHTTGLPTASRLSPRFQKCATCSTCACASSPPLQNSWILLAT